MVRLLLHVEVVDPTSTCNNREPVLLAGGMQGSVQVEKIQNNETRQIEEITQ